MVRVLVVDDSAFDRRLAGGILENCDELDIEYATNGQEALAQLENQLPDVVLTDLQMPEMDGLELVIRIRAKYPLVPVILMTANGSEDIAVQALQRGAASYVSKAKLAQELPDVLQSVLAVSKASRCNDQLINSRTHSEEHFSLRNDTDMIYPLVDHVQQLVSRNHLCDETGRIRVGIALEAALMNALYHGNLELTSEMILDARSNLVSSDGPYLIDQRRAEAPFCDRRIEVQIILTPQQLKAVIRDQGPGFHAAKVPNPTDPANLERPTGRGLLLMKSFMDDVQFNEPGNEVTLIKRREESSAPAMAQV